MTRFKLDENVPTRAAEPLRASGHDVLSAQDQGLGGATDASLARACQTEERVLLTLDLDFADIRSYGALDSPGILVIRLPHQDAENVAAAIQRALPEIDREPLQGSIWILEPRRIRVWRAGA